MQHNFPLSLRMGRLSGRTIIFMKVYFIQRLPVQAVWNYLKSFSDVMSCE